MRYVMYLHNKFSKGGKLLARELGAKRIKHQNSKFKARNWKTIINWGSSNLPNEVLKCKVLNKPENVGIAANKLKTFKRLAQFEDINIPEFTSSKELAKEWLENGIKVFARTILSGHSGSGIVVLSEIDDFVNAPLYVKYVKKTQEYRVHVINGEVVDLTRKARSRQVADENVNWEIRNHDNGFIFMREGVEIPEHAKEMSIKAVEYIGLDFAAIDLIYNESEDKYYILEVNTAAGITGTTLERYKEAFMRLL